MTTAPGSAGQFEIKPNGDVHLSTGLALGKLIHEALTEIHARLDRIEAKLDGPEQLVFHGFGCPGHTTGIPAESCLAKEGDE